MRAKNTLYEPKNFDDPNGNREKLVKEIIGFLQLFIPPILARRITSVLLLLAGVPHDRVAEWTGSCDRSVRQWMNYHTLQQIADMVKEKFDVDVSPMAVSRLLKKTASEN